MRDGALARNPAAVVKRPKVTTKEAAYLTPEQVRTLLEAAKQSRYAPLFSLLVNTGLRRGEALALQWSDIDLDAGLLRVRGTLARVDGKLIATPPKTAKSKRSIPVSETTEHVLKDLRKSQLEERLKAGSQWHQTGYVFTTQDGMPYDPPSRSAGAQVRCGKGGGARHRTAHPEALGGNGNADQRRATQGRLRNHGSRLHRHHCRPLRPRLPRRVPQRPDGPECVPPGLMVVIKGGQTASRQERSRSRFLGNGL